jgi:hypothetical protein
MRRHLAEPRPRLRIRGDAEAAHLPDSLLFVYV